MTPEQELEHLNASIPFTEQEFYHRCDVYRRLANHFAAEVKRLEAENRELGNVLNMEGDTPLLSQIDRLKAENAAYRNTLELALYEVRCCVGNMPHTPILMHVINRIDEALNPHDPRIDSPQEGK